MLNKLLQGVTWSFIFTNAFTHALAITLRGPRLLAFCTVKELFFNNKQFDMDQYNECSVPLALAA